MSDDGLVADLEVRRSETFRLRLNLAIPAGKTVALLGPNGAGKSTTVAAIAGLVAVDSGTVTLNDALLDDPATGIFVPAEARNVGVVFQDYLLFPHLNVTENVAFGLRSRGISREEAISRSHGWMTRLDLDGLERRRPSDLSGGQAQKVALARALVTEPDLLLLDEPLTALDVTTRGELRHTLREHLEAFSGPRLLITHDPMEAFLLADQIHVIEKGVVTQTGTADDIRLRPRTRYAADLAGSNLVSGEATDGTVTVAGFTLHIADHEIAGPVLVTIHPTAVAIYGADPGGSPRNSWQTSVEAIEHLGDRVRLRTGQPMPLTVEVTRESSDSLGLRSGSDIWVAVKATEIGVDEQ